jgi:hypothetical protein
MYIQGINYSPFPNHLSSRDSITSRTAAKVQYSLPFLNANLIQQLNGVYENISDPEKERHNPKVDV